MRRQLVLTPDPIDEAQWAGSRQPSGTGGAVVTFLGVVRGTEAGHSIGGLEYEAFDRMARHQFELLFDELEKRWPIESVRLVHRLGPVKTGDPSRWGEVIAPHRAEAFAACQWLIDEMKRVAPIWKKVVGAEGFEPPTYSV